MKFHQLYDHLFARKAYNKEVATALSLLTGRPRKVLEVGCGTGRHSECLLKEGLRVTAVDPDPEMIRLARMRNRVNLGQNFNPFLGGVHEAPLEKLDAAFSLFHVVNYVRTEQELFDFFSGISLRLKPGKRLIFDSWNGVAAILDPPRSTSPRHAVCVNNQKFICQTKTKTNLWEMTAELVVTIKSGKKCIEKYRYWHRIWLPAELSGFLSMCGMKCERISTWENPQKEATPRDWKIVFVARKL